MTDVFDLRIYKNVKMHQNKNKSGKSVLNFLIEFQFSLSKSTQKNTFFPAQYPVSNAKFQ